MSKKHYLLQTIKFTLLAFLIAAISSCGYTFRGSGSVLPSDIKTVYIPSVENNSSEGGLTQVVTEALRDEFERYGALYVVNNRSEADTILSARIIDVNRRTRTSTSVNDTALQFETELVLSADLKRINGQTLWSSNRINVSSSFGTASNAVVTSSADFASGDINAGDLGSLNNREIARGQERDVLEQLAEKSARMIYNQAVSPDF